MSALPVARRLIEALDRNDPAAMRPLFADDATWWVDTGRDRASGDQDRDPGPQRPWPLHGLMDAQAKCDALEGLPDRFPGGARQHVRRAFADGTTAVLEVEGDGLYLGQRPYRNRYAFLVDVRDGTVTAVREYLDTAHAASVFDGRHLDRRSQTAPPPTPAAPGTAAQEKAAGLLDAISRADGEAVLRLCTPGATWWADTGPTRGSGPEAAVRTDPDLVVVGRVPVALRAPRINDLGHGFPTGLVVRPTRFVEAAHPEHARQTVVAVESRGEGLRHNGRRYQNRYVFILSLDEHHRLTEIREYCDTLHAFDVYELGEDMAPGSTPQPSAPTSERRAAAREQETS